MGEKKMERSNSGRKTKKGNKRRCCEVTGEGGEARSERCDWWIGWTYEEAQSGQPDNLKL